MGRFCLCSTSSASKITGSLIPWDSVHLAYRVNGMVVGIWKKDLTFTFEVTAWNCCLARPMPIWGEVIFYKKMELSEKMIDVGIPKWPRWSGWQCLYQMYHKGKSGGAPFVCHFDKIVLFLLKALLQINKKLIYHRKRTGNGHE